MTAALRALQEMQARWAARRLEEPAERLAMVGPRVGASARPAGEVAGAAAGNPEPARHHPQQAKKAHAARKSQSPSARLALTSGGLLEAEARPREMRAEVRWGQLVELQHVSSIDV